MEKTKTVIINGRHYDPLTGLPVANDRTVQMERPAPVARTNASSTVHASAPQRSQTLNRRIVKNHEQKAVAKAAAPKPVAKAARIAAPNAQPATPQPSTVLRRKATPRPTTGRTMDIARSSYVTKFAPKAATTPVTPDKDHAPIVHPMASRALKKQQKAAQKTVKKPVTAASTKQTAIQKALAAPSPSRKPHKSRGFWGRHRRLWLLIGIVVFVVVVGGYTALVNLPGISVSFAAQQAGIHATYPGYTPDGYSLQQPVTFSDGQVTLNFTSNGGGKGYTINETRSSWDSSAVLQNVVEKAAGTNYITTQQNGLTIYNYGSNAAWVNNSILYTITTQAPLSNEQVRNIATSL